QGSFGTRKAVAELLGVPEKDVRVLFHEGSGSYGRLSSDDASEDAALLSRAVGKPVRVQWMREDEHGWEPKGPAQLDIVRAGRDSKEKFFVWFFVDRIFLLPATTGPEMRPPAPRQMGQNPEARGNPNETAGGGQIYSFDNQKCAGPLIPWVQAD